MGWGDPKIRLRGSQYECECNLRKPGKRERCTQVIKGDNEKDVKKQWNNHKDWHKNGVKNKVNELKKKHSNRMADLLEEYEHVHNIPQNKLNGLHTKGITLPNGVKIPDGQNVNGTVYDENGKRVGFEVMKKYVQGWE